MIEIMIDWIDLLGILVAIFAILCGLLLLEKKGHQDTSSRV